jgi:drug/metabolite transporter (DMT)-like permease
VHRSSYNYWVARKSIIKPEKVKQLAEVKRIHSLSNGSAGARTIAIIVGLFGVVAIVQPGSDDFSMLSILAIVGMLGFAGRDLASRAAPARVNTTLLGLYGFGAIVVVGGLFSVWQQQPFVVIGEPLSQDMQLGSILIISSGLLLTSFRRR